MNMRINSELIQNLLNKNDLFVDLNAFFMNKISKCILNTIEKINYSNILKEINRINQKVQLNTQQFMICPYWIFAQKKVFIFVVLNLLYEKTVEGQNIRNQVLLEDEMFIREINEFFPAQPPAFIAYQLGEFVEKQTNRMWTFEQQQLLQDIVSKLYPCKNEINWKTIAYSLFLKSQRKFYRTFHQIRQKWLNYFDPTVKKGKWTPQQDLQLLNSIQKWGKRWSKISRNIGKSRTQHMVKNRFNSLLKKNKQLISSLNEEQTLAYLLQKTKNQILSMRQDNNKCNNSIRIVSKIKYYKKQAQSKIRKPRSKVKSSVMYQSTLMTDLESKSSLNCGSNENFRIEKQQSDDIKIDWPLDDNDLFFRTELFEQSVNQVLNYQFLKDFYDEINQK